MEKVRVSLTSRSYDIRIGAGVLAETGDWLRDLGFTGKVVVVTNPVVGKLYGAALASGLGSDFSVIKLEVPDGEAHKSLETAGRLYLELADAYAERGTPILALGGGVIGDLAGFVAATYLRGVPLVQIPTTLLAQVDSSIGGKVAVNHGRLKNEVGAFYQPRLVVSDTNTLKTLPAEIFTQGLAEVIKYGVISDGHFFTYLEDNMEKIKARDMNTLEKIVTRSAEIKAEVVSEDERESGRRTILNYGHTIAHAIETVSNFKVSHGAAVAIGMVATARISQEMGMMGQEEVTRLAGLIARAGLPIRVPDLAADSLVEAMGHDKKVNRGRVRFVLPRRWGEVLVSDEVSLKLVRRVLAGG